MAHLSHSNLSEILSGFSRQSELSWLVQTVHHILAEMLKKLILETGFHVNFVKLAVNKCFSLRRSNISDLLFYEVKLFILL